MILSFKTSFPIIWKQYLLTTGSIMVCIAWLVITANLAIVTGVYICVMVEEYDMFSKCYYQPLPYQINNYLVLKTRALVFSFFLFLFLKHISVFSVPSKYLELRISTHKLCSKQSLSWILSQAIHPNFNISLVYFCSVKSFIWHQSGPTVY